MIHFTTDYSEYAIAIDNYSEMSQLPWMLLSLDLHFEYCMKFVVLDLNRVKFTICAVLI